MLILEAYYSQEMADRYGTVFWEGEDGDEIECTCVGSKPKWRDSRFVGHVTKYLRGKIHSVESNLL